MPAGAADRPGGRGGATDTDSASSLLPPRCLLPDHPLARGVHGGPWHSIYRGPPGTHTLTPSFTPRTWHPQTGTAGLGHTGHREPALPRLAHKGGEGGHWAEGRTADGRGARGCRHLSRSGEQGAVLHVQRQLCSRTAMPRLCPSVGTGMALAPGVLLELCSGTPRRSGGT